MKSGFEWDEEKARQNLQKHRVSFEEATTVFSDPFSVTIDDPLHSTKKERFVILGYSEVQRLSVSYTHLTLPTIYSV